MYNTARHVQQAEQRLGVQPQLEPALVIVIMLVLSVGNGIYVQEHLNRLWDRGVGVPTPMPGGGALPPMPGA